MIEVSTFFKNWFDNDLKTMSEAENSFVILLQMYEWGWTAGIAIAQKNWSTQKWQLVNTCQAVVSSIFFL